MVTAVLHALMLYGRGHYNVHLGDSVVTALRRDLFEHLQQLSVGFYTRERTGSILSRMIHDVHEAASIIYGGIVVAALDAMQLLVAFVLLLGIHRRARARRVAESGTHAQLMQLGGAYARLVGGQAAAA